MPTWAIVLLTRSVALIVISNGLGHLQRQLAFYNYLTSQDLKVTIFCHLDDLKKLDAFNVNAKQLEIRVADIPKLVKDGFFENLSYRLSSFDIVVSDNCVDLLRSRQDTVLFASFFWHKAVNMPSWYGYESEELIDLYRPKIIANRLFVSDYLQNYNNLHLVGFFGETLTRENHSVKDILLSFGFSGEINKYFVEIADYVIEFCLKAGKKLWLEPRYYKYMNLESKDVVPATYSDQMYKSIDLGIVRPGIGTLTNLIGVRSKIICIHEKNNYEMLSNANRISSFGFGKNAPDILILGKLLNNLDKMSTISKERARSEFDGEIKSFEILNTSG